MKEQRDRIVERSESISKIFIERPVATSLLTVAIALSGVFSYLLLPVSPLPQVEFPTISVTANLPGASPETMAATVASPLERALGAIAGVSELTSSSSLGSRRVTLQFDLSKNIDSAAREVQAAINAARVTLPSSLPSNPTYRKVNPADSPVLILSLTSPTMSRGQMYDAASTVLAQRISQLEGVGQVTVGGSALPAVRVAVDLPALTARGISLEGVRTAIASSNVNRPKGIIENDERAWQITANDQARKASDYLPLIVAYKNGSPVRLSDVAKVTDGVQDSRNMGLSDGQPSILLLVYRESGANILDTVEGVNWCTYCGHGVVSGRSQGIQASLSSQPVLILSALVAIYLILGILYESLIHPLTILSTLPSAGAGAILALMLFKMDFSIIAFIGVILLIGIVKKNAIVMIDVAIDSERRQNCSAHEAIFQACLLRLRPILMTTLAALFGALPLALVTGDGAEMRQPLGISIIGGLLVSQLLTLYTTPVVYLGLDGLRTRFVNRRGNRGKLISQILRDAPKRTQLSEA